jgi:hypothetical protein
MPVQSAKKLSELRLEEERASGSERFIDMGVDIVYVQTKNWHRRFDPSVGECLISVGGRWDRKLREYIGDPEEYRRVCIHEGQLDAAVWFAEWIQAYTAGEKLDPPIYTVGFQGGRRAGKTDLGMDQAAIVFPVAVPESISWLVTPEEEKDESDEIRKAVESLLPASWYVWHESKRTFSLANGSKIRLRSAHNPASLKKGRADFVLLNEAQRMQERAYVNVRAPVADCGGLVLMAFNPPDEPVGEWVGDFIDETRAGKRPNSKAFIFDPTKNPMVDHESLAAIRKDVTDPDTYRREILGEMIPIKSRVLWGFSPTFNVAPTPDIGEISDKFLKQNFGRPFAQMATCDFQMSPHMAATIWRFFPDPHNPNDVLAWIVDEFILEQANEDDLLDALEGAGYRGDETVPVVDASGEWQNAERDSWRGSFDMFRSRGWKFVCPPDRDMKKNPLILERVAATNARFCDARVLDGKSDGVRHLMVAPWCEHVIKTCKNWENSKQGFPSRRSKWSHVGDCITYGAWRLWPRKRAKGKVEFLKAERQTTERRKDLEGW